MYVAPRGNNRHVHSVTSSYENPEITYLLFSVHPQVHLNFQSTTEDMDVQHHFEFKAVLVIFFYPNFPLEISPTCWLKQVEFEPAPELEDENARKDSCFGSLRIHIRLMVPEIRRSPVEGKVVYPIIYGVFRHPRWCTIFSINSIKLSIDDRNLDELDRR